MHPKKKKTRENISSHARSKLVLKKYTPTKQCYICYFNKTSDFALCITSHSTHNITLLMECERSGSWEMLFSPQMPTHLTAQLLVTEVCPVWWSTISSFGMVHTWVKEEEVNWSLNFRLLDCNFF